MGTGIEKNEHAYCKYADIVNILNVVDMLLLIIQLGYGIKIMRT